MIEILRHSLTFIYLKFKSLPVQTILVGTQQAHNMKMTSYQRRCDVITSHRRWYDVILTLCAHWIERMLLDRDVSLN